MITEFEIKTKQLIDSLKGICASYGLGNDGNEFKIITQVFLYKFLNDKFAYELKKVNELCQEATHFVSSLSHEKFILHLLETDFLTEEEVGIFKRGRNTKTSKRDTKEHRYSTGFECLIGHLYLNECKDRIYEIFDEFKRYVNETNLRQI